MKTFCDRRAAFTSVLGLRILTWVAVPSKKRKQKFNIMSVVGKKIRNVELDSELFSTEK
jgi:hypothetical protein